MPLPCQTYTHSTLITYPLPLHTYTCTHAITLIFCFSSQVGGLGLSLSSAEIVIFAEHDWNPMVDLQAQDRAHRIGQLKSLCIYRLYSEDTIEEKMLNIQKRKTCIAETVVNNVNKLSFPFAIFILFCFQLYEN